MKRICLLTTFMMVFVFVNAKTIWTGSTVIDWNNSGYLTVDASNFNDTQIGDTLVFYATNIADISTYPTIQLTKSDWTGAISGSAAVNFKEGNTTIRFIVNKFMLPELQSGGVVVTGVGFTLTSIEQKTGQGATGLDANVWLGDVIIGNWDNWATVPASCFKDATVGQLLRITFRDAGSGSQGHLSYSDGESWKDVPSATDYVSLSLKYYQFTITADMLSTIKQYGLIIAGYMYTVTGVQLIEPTTLPEPLTTEVLQTTNWQWVSPDQPKIEVKVTNPHDNANTADVFVDIKTDMGVAVAEFIKIATLAANEVKTFEFPFTAEPSIYKVNVMVNDDITSFNIAVDPEQMVAPVDKPTDFEDFWTRAKVALAAVPMDATMTKMDEYSSDKRTVYLVEMKSVGDKANNMEPVTIKGYYAEPTGEGTFPTIITFQGYDHESETVPHFEGDWNPNYAEFQASARGQKLCRNRLYGTINYESDGTTVAGTEYITYSLDDKEDFYYREAYLDCLRALDFVCSRNKVDKNRIYAQGGSQGGAFTIACAALSDGKIAAIAPSIPFMGDFPEYFKVAAWPRTPIQNKQAELGLTDEQVMTTLSYFDTKNLATLITCPVTMATGLQDNVCPDRINFAFYNNLSQVEATNKEYIIYPNEVHSVPYPEWQNRYEDFFDRYTISTGITKPVTSLLYTNSDVYTLQGIKIGNHLSLLPHGVYIVNGKKLIK